MEYLSLITFLLFYYPESCDGDGVLFSSLPKTLALTTALPHNKDKSNQSLDRTIGKDVPTATYFVRAYAYDSAGEEVAFGQTTDAKKTMNLFEIQGISGRHISLEIVSICFSAFSVVSFFGFFLVEKRKNKRLSNN